MNNSNFKGFDCVVAKGTNLNLGWGSIQEWGCIQGNTVFGLVKVVVGSYLWSV